MISEFRTLNEKEIALMYKAPALVAILIAGADDDIEEKELAVAEKLSKFRKVSGDTTLMHYYEEVHNQINETISILLKSYPATAAERNPLIESELEELNNILPKLKKKFAVAFYKSLKSLAKNIAEASGGVIGFFSIGAEEKKLISLPVINNPA